MANSRLSFVIAIRLLTENFNKGANRIKASLLSMQRNFLALASAAGAGTIGLSNFVSKAIEVAKATTQASVVLKNVSGSTAAFAENQKWLLDVAKRYGVEINTLTTGFAKFKAAADISSMSLEDQRKIFESVSRASVAFGLSAEDQRGVFMALSQMMSKNKVMAEELRLQLAERIPVAIQAMAKAAGVTVNELDALMKQSKVMSSDVLPKFAEALNELIPNVDTDNLNKSLVDLSNTFTKLIKELDVEGYFKKVVESVTQGLSYLAENAKRIISSLDDIIALGFSRLANNAVKALISSSKNANAAAVKSYESFMRARDNMRKAERLHGTDSLKYTKAFESFSRAQSKLTLETRLRNYAAHTKGWKSAVASMRAGILSLGASLKSLLLSNAITGIVMVLYEGGRALAKMVAHSKEMRNLMTDSAKRMNKLSQESKQSIDELQGYASMLYNQDAEVRSGALQKINELLGTSYEYSELFNSSGERNKSIQDAINEKIRARLRLIELENKAQNIANEKALIHSNIQETSAKIQRREERFGWTEKDKEIWTGGLREDLAKYSEAYSGLIIQEANVFEEMAKIAGASSKNGNITTPVTGGNPVKVEVVNLDAGDVPELEAVAVGQKSADRIVGEAISEAFDRLILKQVADDKAREIAGRRRDTSGDWKLSDAEIMAADIEFNKSKINDLIEHWVETGALMGESLTEAIGENVDLKKALQATEIKDALTNLRKEMDDAIMNGLENTVSNIDGIVNAFDRLKDAVDEDASAWESLMAVWDLFSSTTQSIIGIIESVAAAKRIQAEMEKAAAAESIAASTGEAAASVGKGVAKQTPGWAALIAVPAAISAIIAAFAMIPKFAKGGIVGGTSTHGDKVLARLNSGEGVLTPDGLESLHDAANPRNARSVKVTGVLTGRGRDLKAIIDAETKFLTRTK